jgi:hypothetical protein
VTLASSSPRWKPRPKPPGNRRRAFHCCFCLFSIGLEDFPLPLFDQGLEGRQGMPENGTKLKQLFIDHDGLLIASRDAARGLLMDEILRSFMPL